LRRGRGTSSRRGRTLTTSRWAVPGREGAEGGYFGGMDPPEEGIKLDENGVPRRARPGFKRQAAKHMGDMTLGDVSSLGNMQNSSVDSSSIPSEALMALGLTAAAVRQGSVHSQSTGSKWSMVSDNGTLGTDDLSTPGGRLRAAARRQGSRARGDYALAISGLSSHSGRRRASAATAGSRGRRVAMSKQNTEYIGSVGDLGEGDDIALQSRSWAWVKTTMRRRRQPPAPAAERQRPRPAAKVYARPCPSKIRSTSAPSWA